MLETLGFAVVAFMLTAYVLLDGYDLGVALVSPLVARGDRERAAALRSIGPFWNGNEVWLVAAGGALFALFPAAYASAFSGFYLPFVVVLWLLMFRGIAVELRNHLASTLWHQFWDAAFVLSSGLLIVLLGVALGNLVRGVPLDAGGYFQGTFAFLLNPYALLIAAFALAALAQHGAAFTAMRVDGEPGWRAVRLVRGWWWAVLVLFVASGAATVSVRGIAPARLAFVGPAIALGALIWLRVENRRGRAASAFAASVVFLAALLAEAARTLYPYLISAYPPARGGLSIYQAAPSRTALEVALTVAIGGSAAALAYGSVVWRRMGAKIRVE